MATSTPFLELIAQDLITVLKRIKTANTFRTQVEDVNITRFLKNPDAEMDFSNFPALFLTDGDEDVSKNTNREVLSSAIFFVVGTVRYNKDADEIPSTQANNLIADVKEAIMDTTTILWTNGNATNVHIDAVARDAGFLEPESSFQVTVRIEYEYAHDDAGRQVQG